MLYVNGEPLEIRPFPIGEVRIPAGQLSGARNAPATIRFSYQSDADLLHLFFLADHLAEIGAPAPHLVIDYMPYARMDRASEDLFTLRSVTSRINALNFASVLVIEPHSDVTPALLNRVSTESPTTTWLLEAALYAVDFDIGYDYLLFPDAGAQKRYGDLAEHYNYLVGLKHRNHGKLSQFQLVGPDTLPDGAQVVIVDDLCSYGNTFIALAQLAADKYAPRAIHLVVTHLEPSIYRGKLLDSPLIDSIFASTSIQPAPLHDKVRLYDVATHQPVLTVTEKGESNA